MDNIEKQAQLSYNPLPMALLWESLATRETRLLNISMRERSRIDPRRAWVNYVRSHDDIGWTFDDDDARRVGIDPAGRRRFLNDFYTGRFPDSFARGLPFQENPRTDWTGAARRDSPTTMEGRVYAGLARLIALRKGTPALADGALEIVETDNGHVFGYVRRHDDGRVLVLANFSESAQPVSTNTIRLYALGYAFTNLVTGDTIALGDDGLTLEPYQLLCLGIT